MDYKTETLNINPKILVVEDEPALSSALRSMLIREKYEVTVAKDGQEGLVRAFTDHPDLILLDVIMPVMDGMTMLSALRKDVWGRNVPVILLTNLFDTEKIAQSMEQGVFDYLVKSDWKLEDIIKKVKEKLA